MTRAGLTLDEGIPHRELSRTNHAL